MATYAVCVLLFVWIACDIPSLDAQGSRKRGHPPSQGQRPQAAHLLHKKLINPAQGRRRQSSRPLRLNSRKKQKDTISEERINELTETFKMNVERLKTFDALDLLFVIDESSSVGLINFLDEIKFVSRFVSGIEVDMNHTRVAVVTYSDDITAWVNQVSMDEIHAHKCSLLGNDLPNIKYVGGGTYTKGALTEVEHILENAREHSYKVVFLITDGYSNGGDPRPIATALKRQGVEVFTFGIKDGDKEELASIASSPKQEHRLILNSFKEFEAVARRALHSDLEAGRYIVEDNSHCDKFCTDNNCCHNTGDCRCGTTTGKYECVCRPGYYGSGLKLDEAGCHPCPEGTYKDEALPGNIQSCIPCPDPRMNSTAASTSIDQCICEEGFKKEGDTCQVLMCEELQPPANGHFVDCDRKYHSSCTAACNTGYDLQGTATIYCAKDERWTTLNGSESTGAFCQVRYCEALTEPDHGTMNCSNDDSSYSTVCDVTCDEGYRLHGSASRTCESQRRWTGAEAECWEIICPSIPELNHGNISGDCPTTSKGKYGNQCSFSCPQEGYQLVVAPTITCEENGHWYPPIGRENSRICNDTSPPVISCPSDMTLLTATRSSYASATWKPPFTTDNSGIVTVSPVFTFPVSLHIGDHTITYTASDDSGLTSQCSFTVSVKDHEPPMIDRCTGPQPFVIKRGQTQSEYIEWTEPTFSDNSGSLSVRSNGTFGIFPMGVTVIEYAANDTAGNERKCYIDIYVQDNTCPPLEKPRRGHIDCRVHGRDSTECDMICDSNRDGFAMFDFGNPHYVCNTVSNEWVPELTIPMDCSKKRFSSKVLKDFQAAYSMAISDVSCNHPDFLEGVRQYFFDKFSSEVASICADKVDGMLKCVLVDVTVKCISKEVVEEDPEYTVDYPEYPIYYGDDIVERDRRKKRSLPGKSNSRTKRNTNLRKKSKRVRRQSESLPPEDDQSEANGGSYFGGEPYYYYGGEQPPPTGNEGGYIPSDLLAGATRVETDVGFEGREMVPDDAREQIEGEIRILVGDVIPDDFLNGEDAPVDTIEEIQVHLTIRGEVPLEGVSEDEDRSRHTRMVEFIRNLELVDYFRPAGSLNRILSDNINATTKDDLGYVDESYAHSKDELICPVGTVLKDKAYCANCPVGTIYDVTTAFCKSCPIGYYQDLEAQLSCQPCPTGTSTEGIHSRGVEDCKKYCSPGYSSSTGLEVCTGCRAGTFADFAGATVCTTCPPGNGTIGIGADSLDDCGELCKPGFVSVTGFAPCTPCPTGTFQNKPGMTFCHVCSGNEERVMEDFVMCTEAIPGEDLGIGRLYYSECFKDPCKNNATCKGQETTFTCECQPGYTGKFCEDEINECLSSPCADTSTCVDLIDEFRCECGPGYTGRLCNIEIDECASDPCANGATCVDRIDAFSCDCANGYQGTLCELDIDECASNPCENGGTCVDEVAGYRCECAVGFKGAVCQTNIDDCEDNPCQNKATCIDGINEFRCICTLGFRGDLCEENINECESNPCVNGECLDLTNSYKCLCPPTYLGVHCEEVGDPYFDLEFDKPNTYHHARLDYALPNMTEVTVSFYLRSNTTETYGTPFSYAVGDELEADALALTDLSALTFYVNGKFAVTDSRPVNDGQWYLITVVWTSETGAWAIYLNGRLEDSGENLAKGTNIPGGGVLIIGQEQDTLGGGFSASQEFLGTISQFNIYNYAMTPDQVRLLWRNCAQNLGNVRAWPEFAGGIVGKVEKSSTRFCLPCPTVESDAGTVITPVNNYTIEVDCTTGHKLAFPVSPRVPRPYTFRCGNDAVWKFFGRDKEPEVIKCVKVECGELEPINLGQVQTTGHKYEDNATYTCIEGYRPDGNSVRTCQANKRWSGTSPTCVDVDECLSDEACHRKANCTNSIGSYSCACVHGWKGDGHTCREIDCGGAGSLIFGSIQGNNFKLGGVVRYSCDYGYRLEGPSERVCLFNDSWSEYMPECVKVECEEPDDVRHAFKKPKAAIWDYKSQITYTCQPGYYMIGEATRECGPDSQWTGTAPHCDRVSCGNPPAVANSVHITEKGILYGDRVNYVCEKGYRSLGPSVLTCNASKIWEGKDGKLPVCEHPTCSNPLTIINAEFVIMQEGESTVTDATYTYGTKVKYSCNLGYNLVGESTITCVEEGLWDKLYPRCEIVSCGPPPQVENAFQHHNGELFSDLANYMCKPGYVLEGEAALTCLASGKWTDDEQVGPSCNPRPCPTPRNVDHSKQTLTEADGYVYLAVVSYECDLGYWESGTDTINCDTEGQWQPAQDYACDIAVCPEPQPPQYGSVARAQPTSGENFEYSNTISFSCNSGFYLVGEEAARCTEHGNWSNAAPVCLPVECAMPAEVPNSGHDIIDGPYGTGALFESQLSYGCNSGYEQVSGDASRECTHDGTWTGSAPACSRVLCGKAPGVTHGFPMLILSDPSAGHDVLFYQDTAEYICDTGFYLDGDFSVQCTATREFSDYPSCEPYECGDPPQVEYATYHSEHVFGENVYQSNVTYLCEPDFEMTGSPVRECDEYGHWSTNDPAVCQPITCGDPDVVQNAVQFVSSSEIDVAHPELYKTGKYQPRSAAITACDKGYVILEPPYVKSAPLLLNAVNTANASDNELARGISEKTLNKLDLEQQDRMRKILSKFLQEDSPGALVVKKSVTTEVGPTTLHIRQCSESIGWLKSAPICVPILCPSPLKLENGHLTNADDLNTKPPFQTGINYACDEGYKFVDASSINETRTSTCEWSDDLWNVYLTPLAKCEPLPCPTPPSTAHGSFSQPEGESFVFKDVVTYTCDSGYEMTAGSPTFNCESSQTWSDAPPTCSPVKCPKPERPVNGNFKGKSWIYESVVSFKCDNGYNLMGMVNLTCQANRTWSAPYPQCNPVPCGPPPEVENSISHATSEVYLGCAIYSCKHGFYLSGYSKLKCTASGQWREKPPTCEFILCQRTPLPPHVTYVDTKRSDSFPSRDSASYIFDDVVTYSCEDGYETNDINDLSATCQTGENAPSSPSCDNIELFTNVPSGSWSRKPPICTPKDCGKPPDPHKNSLLVGNDTTYNNTVHYICKNGYFTDDSDPSATCLSNAIWSRSTSPACLPVPCGVPDTPNNGFFDGTVFTFKSEVVFTCDAGHNLVGPKSVTCLASGRWSSVSPVCEPKDCGELALVENGKLEFEGTIFGEEAIYSCNDGYFLKGESLFECTETGKWSHPTRPKCLPKDCGVLTEPEKGLVNATGHVFMDTASYSCLPGYYLVGSNKTECLADALWSEPTPECRPVDCGNLPSLENGHVVVKGPTTFKSSQKYGCDSGYEMVGSATVTCQADKTWTQPPVCNRVQCPSPSLPVNGMIAEGAQTEYRYQDQITYGCKQGYFTDDVTSSECTAGRTWSNPPPMCSPVDCGELSPVDKGLQMGWKTTFMSVVSYSCWFGYYIVGNTSLECLHTATWSSPVPTCQRVSCGRPLTLKHGTITGGDNAQNWVYERKIEFSCNEGYHLHGSSGAECDGDGEWAYDYNEYDEDSVTYEDKLASPTCELITCGTPASIANGSYPQRNYIYGDIIAYTCDVGYEMVKNGDVVCTGVRTSATGYYRGELPVCNPVSCGPPRNIENGEVTFQRITFKNKANYKCNEGYNMIGDGVVNCMASRHWSPAPRCLPKNCDLPDFPDFTDISVQSTVFPAVLNIGCQNGYYLQGPNTMKCTKDGEWSNVGTFECLPVSCGNPADLENGIYNFNGIVFKKKATYQCHSGYYMVEQGRELVNNTVTITCQANGTWQDGVPRCEPMECGEPPETDHGSSDVNRSMVYPETVTYRCDYGYQFIPSVSSAIQCTASGKFSGPAPKCLPVSCGSPPPAPNSSVSAAAVTYQNTAEYTCKFGYTFAFDDGVSEQFTSVCSGEKEWKPLPPDEGCIPYDCGPAPILENAEVPPYNPNTKFGVMFTYDCITGHEAHEESLSITCERYGIWSDGPSCQPVDCGQRHCPNKSNCESPDTIFESKFVSKCVKGYEFQPGTTEFEVHCQADATWSIPEDIDDPNRCVRHSCGDPPIIGNGNSISESSPSEANLFESSYHYECDPGFDFTGNTKPISCLADGTWGPGPLPSCEAKDCGQPPSCIEHAICKFETTTFRSIYMVSCNEGYETEYDVTDVDVVCNELGEWAVPDSEHFLCLPIECGILPSIKHGHAVFSADNGVKPKYQEKIQYQCDDGYYAVGEWEVTCLSNRSYTKPPVCLPVSCGSPFQINDGQTNSTGEIFESEVDYACNPGYYLSGEKNWICSASAEWMPIISEPVPPVPPIARSSPTNYTTRDLQELFSESSGVEPVEESPDSFRRNLVATLDESSGMEISDAGSGTQDVLTREGKPDKKIPKRSRRNAGEMAPPDPQVAATEKAVRTQPACLPVPCGIPPIVANAEEKFTEMVVYGQAVTYRCKPGFEMIGEPTLQCQSNGKLGPSPPPSCVRVVCPMPGVSPNCALIGSAFKFEDKLVYKPQKGYEFSPSGPLSITLTCTETGRSDVSSLPSCVKVSCGAPNDVPNGKVHTSAFTYQENATYTCDKGYQLKGKQIATCLSTRKWSSNPPECNPVSCGTPPSLLHGSMLYIYGDVNPFTYGQHINYTCHNGFMFDNDKVGDKVSVQCRHDRKWDPELPSCVPVPCPELLPLVNGDITTTGALVFRAKATYKCSTGYEMQGEPALTCQASGEWSSEPPTCNPVSCDFVPRVPYSNQQTRKRLVYGETVSYQCIPGYELEGNQTLNCLDDRQFDHPVPVCAPVQCPTPSNLEFGFFVEDAEEFLFMNTITYKCNDGYEMVSEAGGAQSKNISCQADKNWSDGVPKCQIKSCGNPDALENGLANYTTATYQSIVSYSCNSGYEISKHSSDMEKCSDSAFCMACQANAIWGNGNSETVPALPICSPVSCGEPPTLTNANSESDSLVYQGSTTYKCNTGYEFPGKDNITIECRSDAQWSGQPVPECERVKCPNPIELANGKVIQLHKADGDSSSYVYEDIIKYECDNGYQPSAIVNLTCGSDRRWDSEPPICYPVSCGSPPLRQHGHAISQVKKSLKITFQSVITYTCDEGYEFNGDKALEEIVCTADAVWSSTQPPSCTPVDCGRPLEIEHGSFSLRTNETTYKSKVEYTCDVGHELIGDAVLKCRSDKHWKPSVPACLPVSCSIPPDIEHGSPVLGPPKSRNASDPVDNQEHRPKKRDLLAKLSFVYEDTASYQCDVGYSIKSGSNIARCDEDANWVDLPICSIVTCEALPPGNNSQKMEDVNTYSSVITYSCNEGYILFGEITSIDCVCRQDGFFSPASEQYISTICRESLPECVKRSCGSAPTVRKSIIVGKKKEYLYQDELEYGCAEGYQLSGKPRLRCNANGKFNAAPPRCRRISCGAPPSLENAATVVHDGTKFLDVISYECHPGHALVSDSNERLCQSDGTWTQNLVQCDPVNCSKISLPENANIVNPADTKFGSTVTFQCQDGYNLLGRQSISCEASGKWSSFAPECMPVPCDPVPEVENGIPFSNFMIHRYNDSVNFICMDGHLMEGQASIKCLTSGAWTRPPRCIPVECPDVPSVSNAQVENMKLEPFTFMEAILYVCDPGYIPTSKDSMRVCQADGTFSNEPVSCGRIPCPTPSEIAHGTPSMTSGVYEDKITYSCDDGYEILGSDSLLCGMQGEWVGPLPVCEPVSCGAPPTISNGNLKSENDEYYYQEIVHYECLDGHEFHGPSTANCRADRKYQVNDITCLPVTCPDITVSESSGNVELDMGIYSGDDEETRIHANQSHEHWQVTYMSKEKEYLSEASITCDSGFVLESGNEEEKFVCQANRTWSGNFVETNCIPIECPKLNIFANGQVEITPSPESRHTDKEEGTIKYDQVHIFGTKATFSCNKGYNLEGTTSLTCTAEGRWSGLPPRCSPVPCGTPAVVENSIPIESSFSYGMIAEYECAEKYYLGKNKFVTCQADGTFSDKKIECLPILCPQFPPTGHGVPLRNESRVGDENSYICDDGYESASTVGCLLSGEWNGGLDPCTPVKCNDVLSLGNAVLTQDINFEYGDSAEYVCILGHFLPNGSQILTIPCGTDGNFKKPDVECAPIECALDEVFDHGRLQHADNKTVYRDSATLLCDEGYISSIGTDELFCTDTGLWDNLEASCDIVQCGKAPNIPNASPVLDDMDHVFTYGENVLYQCNEGFKTYNPGPIANCLANGTFGGIDDELCVPITCPIPDEIDFGVMSKEEAVYGESLVIDCEAGFQVEGLGVQEITLTCEANGQWSEDLAQINCIPIICNPLDALEFGSIFLQDEGTDYLIHPDSVLQYGSTIRYKCDTGYTLKGISKQHCLPDGTWSGTLPVCSPVECGKPPFILHGSITGGEKSTYGNNIVYKCDEGYLLNPPESKTRTCNELGSWTGEHPFCEIISCGEVPPVMNGQIDSYAFTYESEIGISCNEGYVLEKGDLIRTCLINGSWSGEEPACARMSCGEHPPVEFGTVEPEGISYVGDMVSITCEDGVADLLVGDPVRVCGEDGHWEGIEPKCIPYMVKNLIFDRPECDPPVIPNTKTKLVEGQHVMDIYHEGDVLEYCCAPGYIPASNMIIQCHQGGWTGLPECVLKCRYKCGGHGRCVGNNRCSCNHGWKGSRCHQPVCTSHCLNGGFCSGPNLCSCKSGWKGTRCEKPVCTKPCQNGGRCTSPDECYCPHGYSGVDCTETSFFNIW